MGFIPRALISELGGGLGTQLRRGVGWQSDSVTFPGAFAIPPVLEFTHEEVPWLSTLVILFIFSFSW